jgi:hypothetical protein
MATRHRPPATRQRTRQSPPAPAGISAAALVALAQLVLGPVAIMPGALNRFVFVKVALVAAGAAVLRGAGRRRRQVAA